MSDIRWGNTLNPQEVLEMHRRMGRVIARTLAGDSYRGEGSLLDRRGFEMGTRGDIEQTEVSPEVLAADLGVSFVLITIPADFTGTTFPRICEQQCSFINFVNARSERQRVAGLLARAVPEDGAWGLIVSLIAVAPVAEALLTHPATRKLGPFPSGRELDEDFLILGVDSVWTMMQSSIRCELEFRRRFAVGSFHATQYYIQLVAQGSDDKNKTGAYSARFDDIINRIYSKFLNRYNLRIVTDSGAEISRSTGYINLALHYLRQGNDGLAAQFVDVALSIYRTGDLNWSNMQSTTHREVFDGTKAAATLGPRERAFLRVLQRRPGFDTRGS
jgi:hypothetical protein